MPKSRHRRKGRTRRPTPARPFTGPHAHGLAANWPWIRRMFEVDEAEAAGDALAALRLIEDMRAGPDGRTWWRPQRIRRLRQIVELDEAAPAWVWARWVVAQAAQVGPADFEQARDQAIETRGGSGTLWGTDEGDAIAKVIDHDWVFRQLVLHEQGGLVAFLSRTASARLLARADGIAAWVDVPMGGYELLDEAPAEITWRDLGSGGIVRTINMGGASMMATGECVLGRVVSSGGVSLFESAPLCVPPELARMVAHAPESWVEAVAEACRGANGAMLIDLIARLHHFDLLCDLPSGLRRHLVEPPDPGLRSDHVGTGGNGRQYDAALVLAALGGEVDVDSGGECECGGCEDAARPLAPFVAAALLEPGTAKSLAPLLVPSDAPALMRLAGVLASPADVVCRSLVERLGAAA